MLLRNSFLFLLLVAFFVGPSVSSVSSPPPFEELWFDQNVDHFNLETTPDTFKQRYLVHDSYWGTKSSMWGGQKGPIFFYTGNEGSIDSFYENSGFVFELAQTFGALVIFAEHRFYGKSYPYGLEASYDKEHIGLLSVEQALADYAVLIAHLKKTLSGASASPVIAFGGSYGGMLSAWIRMKYPASVDGALAASAPILWGTNVSSATFYSQGTHGPGYFETVTNDFAMADERCPGLVRNAFSDLLKLSKTPSGLDQISGYFSLCSTLAAHQVEHLMLWAVNAFGNLAMMNYPYPTNFLAPLPAWPVKVACKSMIDYADNPIKGLSQIMTLYYGNIQCHNLTEEFVECADQTGCGTGPSGMSWDYQTCTEVIYFPNTNNVTDMFPPREWTLDDLKAHCRNAWSVQPRPTWLKTYTGGENIKYSSRIIFSNGLLDPWHGGGFLESLSDSLIAIIIKEGAHHLDLRGRNAADPPSVVDARRQEMNIIAGWLRESYGEKELARLAHQRTGAATMANHKDPKRR